MNDKNDNRKRIHIDTPPPSNGVGAVLCRTARPGPRDSWAVCASPSVENGERSQMDEVGALLRRELFTACLEPMRIKLPAAEVDAYMAAMGLALSTLASHLLKTSVRVAYSSKHANDNFPDDLREAFAKTAERISSVDGEMAPAMNLARMLAGRQENPDEHPAERAERALASELISGCVILSALSDTKDQRLNQLASLLIGATADAIARDMGIPPNGEQGEE